MRPLLQAYPPWAMIQCSSISFCIRILQNLRTLCTVADFFSGIACCYIEISAIPYRQMAGTKHVRFHEVVPADFNSSGENRASLS